MLYKIYKDTSAKNNNEQQPQGHFANRIPVYFSQYFLDCKPVFFSNGMKLTEKFL